MKSLTQYILENMEFSKISLLESLSEIKPIESKKAIDMILKSIPGLKNFDESDENKEIIAKAKEDNKGFWLFAEWFEKNPMERAEKLNYVGNDKSICSYEVRKEYGKKMLWIMDVQSYEKGSFTKILDYLQNEAKKQKLKYVGLMAYEDKVKSMYIDKFNFKILKGNTLYKKV